MKTTLQLLGLDELTEDKDEVLDIIDAEAVRCRDAGDLVGAGEWSFTIQYLTVLFLFCGQAEL